MVPQALLDLAYLRLGSPLLSAQLPWTYCDSSIPPSCQHVTFGSRLAIFCWMALPPPVFTDPLPTHSWGVYQLKSSSMGKPSLTLQMSSEVLMSAWSSMYLDAQTHRSTSHGLKFHTGLCGDESPLSSRGRQTL